MPRFEPRTSLGRRIAEAGAPRESPPRLKPTRAMKLTYLVTTVVMLPAAFLLLGTPRLAAIVALAYIAVTHAMTLTLAYRRWRMRRTAR